jgi:lipopolysaccharide export system protein LptA
MRRFAPWLAVGIAVLAVTVGSLYWRTRAEQAESLPKPPDPLETTLNASAAGWEWSYSASGKPKVEIRAADFKHVKEPSVFDLTTVELKIFHLDGAKYDRVVSPKAQFSVGEGTLRSDADVEITLGLTEAGGPPGRLIGIQTSGVTFENKTGKADTDRHAIFRLDVGEGEGDGATYDPQTRELRLKSNVKLLWRGHNETAPPMRIEAGELIYKEAEGKVFLMPWAKFSRETLSMTGGPAEITLENGNIRLVSASQASGADRRENRSTEFAADQLEMIFRDGGLIEKVTGQSNARLKSVSPTAETAVTAYRLDLSFENENGDATLRRAIASGESVARSTPVAKPGAALSETRVLKAEIIEMKLRHGGEFIEQIDTHAHGTLEFLPNRAGQRRRLLEAERMSILYADANRLKSFRAVQAATVTEPDPAIRGSERQRTWSDDLQADFDPKTGDLARLEQWGKFRYESGARQARSERALLEPQKDWITLSGGSRVWDPTGATDAETIVLDQKNHTTDASGQVQTVRQPEKPGEEAVRATAQRMRTSSGNNHIRYEGGARLWQGGNRLDGAEIDIDRPSRQIRANGGITNTLSDREGKPTRVEAASMRYSDVDRVSFYEGGVILTRPGLKVRSRRLRAYLTSGTPEENAATVPDSGLDRAFAEGAVEILQSDGSRSRLGKGEVADFYAADNRVVLDGAPAELTDSVPGQRPTVSRGRKLTWSGDTDKLLVDGAASEPAVSSLRRKK